MASSAGLFPVVALSCGIKGSESNLEENFPERRLHPIHYNCGKVLHISGEVVG
jgi:hypothetical protein